METGKRIVGMVTGSVAFGLLLSAVYVFLLC